MHLVSILRAWKKWLHVHFSQASFFFNIARIAWGFCLILFCFVLFLVKVSISMRITTLPLYLKSVIGLIKNILEIYGSESSSTFPSCSWKRWNTCCCFVLFFTDGLIPNNGLQSCLLSQLQAMGFFLISRFYLVF